MAKTKTEKPKAERPEPTAAGLKNAEVLLAFLDPEFYVDCLERVRADIEELSKEDKKVFDKVYRELQEGYGYLIGRMNELAILIRDHGGDPS